MKRKDIEQLNAIEPNCFETDREQQWYECGLAQGLQVADEEPKPRWHDLRKDPNDLPQFCGYDKSDNMIVATDTIFHSCHDYSVAFYDFIAKAWYSYDNLEYLEDVIAWMPLPEWKGGVQ